MARILLVMADATGSLLLAAALQRWGHTVETAFSYNGAAEKFALTHKQFPCTLVITDDCLPETEGGTALDIDKGVQLVRTILKIKKGLSVKKLWMLFYPLYPEIILLSALHGDANPLYRYFQAGKNRLPAKHTYPAVTIMHKGTELEKQLEQKVRELEIIYWKRRYKMTITGLILSALPGVGIIIKNFLCGFSPSAFFYILGIGVMYVVLYFFQVKPYHPSRAVTGIRKTGDKGI